MSDEYPDMAGYPDGKGFLDEGTTDRDEGPEVSAFELLVDDRGDEEL